MNRTKLSVVKTRSRYLLALFFVGGGVMHFVIPSAYVKIMPPYLPLHLELVYLSGVIEIALGAMVAVERSRRLAAWGLVLLLIAVFPANIHLYLHQELVPLPPIVHLLRLPLQAVLIAWAYWHTTPDRQ
jgi:uncharacterized membrane protein